MVRAVSILIGLGLTLGAAPNDQPILFHNLGDYHHAITASASAQKWFDQGLRLVYAFNHDEAIRSFRQGATLDPTCAMCFWGVALALGPNINMPADPAREARARDAMAKAEALAKYVSAPERDYIVALQARYGPDGDRAYADAMRKLARTYPRDADAQTLFAESLMDLRPWDLWTHDGKPQPGTLEALHALHQALKIDPNHPGANHYLIHVLEGSPHPQRALHAAELLPKLMPGAGHIVHMPSHIYLRIGRYADATKANEAAIAADKAYLAGPHATGAYTQMYVAHNYQFLWVSAAMEGRSKESIGAARALLNLFPLPQVQKMAARMPGFDFFLAPQYLSLVRFSKWREILAQPAPPKDLPHLTAYWHFARALACAHESNAKCARAEKRAFDAYVAGLSPQLMAGPTNSMKSVGRIAQSIIVGACDFALGDFKASNASYRKGVMLEDALHYDEPPVWPIPVRELFGVALLKEKKPREAEHVFREDLLHHPHNGWALHGLWKALIATHSQEAQGIKLKFQKAWARADVKLP